MNLRASLTSWALENSRWVGLDLAPDHTARVNAVTAGSPAARAGLHAGDDLVKLDGQPLVFIADVSRVLNHASESASLRVEFRRGNLNRVTTLELPAGWRTRSDITRRVGT